MGGHQMATIGSALARSWARPATAPAFQRTVELVHAPIAKAVLAPRLDTSRLVTPQTGALSAILDGLMLVARTFRPNVLKRKKVHGFLARLRSKDGRKTLNRRRAKGRKVLSG